MNKDLAELIDDAMNKEQALAKKEEEFALTNADFANYLKEKKRQDDELSVLWDMVKEKMIEDGITKHETDYIKLTLSPSGRFKTADIESTPDELCDVKKTLNNKKCKAYLELNGKLPEGVEPTSPVLRKKIL